MSWATGANSHQNIQGVKTMNQISQLVAMINDDCAAWVCLES